MGIDPFLMLAEQYQKIEESMSSSNKKLVQVSSNLVDLVWQAEGTKPPRPLTPVFVHPVKYAGVCTHEVCSASLGVYMHEYSSYYAACRPLGGHSNQ